MQFRILLLSCVVVLFQSCKTASRESNTKSHVENSEEIVFSRDDVEDIVKPLAQARGSLQNIREEMYDLEDGAISEEEFDRNNLYPMLDQINDALDVFFKQVYGNRVIDGELAGTLKKAVVMAKIERLRQNARQFREIRNKIDIWLDLVLNRGDRRDRSRQAAREAKREILILFADIEESIGEIIELMKSLGQEGGGGGEDRGNARINLARCPTVPDVLLGFTDGQKLTIEGVGITREQFCTAFVGYFSQYLLRSDTVRAKLLAGGPLRQPANVIVIAERNVEYNFDLNQFLIHWNVSEVESQIDEIFAGVSRVSAVCKALDRRYESLDARLWLETTMEDGRVETTELLTLSRMSTCQSIKRQVESCGLGRCSVPICVAKSAQYESLENTLTQILVNDAGRASASQILELGRKSLCSGIVERLRPCANGGCRVRTCIPDDASYESLENTIYEFVTADSGKITAERGHQFQRKSGCEQSL
jgi:hypothetical protein